MAVFDNILSILNQWPKWRRITEAPDALDKLTERVEALEKALAKCPAEGCPFCGERAFRLKDVYMNGQAELWTCEACGKEREYRHDKPGGRPGSPVRPPR